MSECRLVEQTVGSPTMSPELQALLEGQDLRAFHHFESDASLTERAMFAGGRKVQRKILTVVQNVDEYTLEQAHLDFMGIRRWRHISVGIQGSLQLRIADAKAIGRKRGPGERSPVPLPDWYDLTHMVYGHAAELGFDPSQPIYQLLPPPDWPYVNYAEALHVRQPA